MSSIAHMTIIAQKVVDNLKINYRRNVSYTTPSIVLFALLLGISYFTA